MADRFRGRPAVRGRAPRRATQWIQSVASTGFTGLAANSVVLNQTFPILEPQTIVRTRGSIWIESDQEAADEEPMGAVGLLVASDQAIAAGVASLPDPISEAASGLWFVWLPFATVIIAVGGAAGARQGWEFPIDSKAMRKVSDGQTIGVVVVNSSALHGLEFMIQFRMLTKLV